MYATISMLGIAVTGLVVAIGFFRARASGKDAQRSSWLLRLLHGAFVLSVLGLAVTAYVAVWCDVPLRGWLLFGHVSAAGAFLVLLPLVALCWLRAPGVLRASGFLIVVGGLLTAVPMLVSMLPFFGTDGLEELLEVHRYAGLTLVIVVLGHGSLARGRHPARIETEPS